MQAEQISQERKWFDVEAVGEEIGMSPMDSSKLAQLLIDADWLAIHDRPLAGKFMVRMTKTGFDEVAKWRTRRALAPLLAGAAQAPRVCYRAALDILGERGLRRDEGETREGFAERIAAGVPSMAQLTRMHLARAFRSRRPIDPAKVQSLMKSVRRESYRQAPWWRILLGHLDPTTWLRVR